MEIYSVNISNWDCKDKIDGLLEYISKEKIDKFKKFKFKEDILRSVYGDILIRNIICRYFNIKNNEINFMKGLYGKPYLKDVKEFNFNISHSGNWVVCVVDKKEVGIDIEQIKPIEIAIAKKNFTTEEYERIIGQKDYLRISMFYNLWTLKESFIKIIGKGLYIPLNSFNVNIYNENNITVRTKNNLETFYFKQYNIDSNYKMAVCSKSTKFPQNVNRIESDDLYEEFTKLNID
ncbi:4'-phosphopantetheinyl transferase superfamily protein [Clostridium estertheticum]|uniref:4'-phosphopantetheinyl transferase family protein n=1 Tax=Clostridium estertheticum TaxID=238834 RepID=UPI001C0CB2D8|nr:4'-phosphopantetheinyl transferase superfamily protein [Clostridium estertheticum]MBU3198547.1 4'-phosphopantetheinyl transferase superfamily protein [Clostridium estertheticum]WAG64527.1 4'-phosphopantetheinyl transferase superfamily protein [Clostridium estertheticum]